MSPQTLVTVVVLGAAAIVALLNQPLLYELRLVRLPWGTVSLPLFGILIAVAAGAVVVMLMAEVASAARGRRQVRALADRLSRREREIAEMKSRAYDEVSQRIMALHRDLDNLKDRVEALGYLLEDYAPLRQDEATRREARTPAET